MHCYWKELIDWEWKGVIIFYAYLTHSKSKILTNLVFRSRLIFVYILTITNSSFMHTIFKFFFSNLTWVRSLYEIRPSFTTLLKKHNFNQKYYGEFNFSYTHMLYVTKKTIYTWMFKCAENTSIDERSNDRKLNFFFLLKIGIGIHSQNSHDE